MGKALAAAGVLFALAGVPEGLWAGMALPAAFGDRVTLTLETGKTSAYEHERIPVKVVLRSRGLSLRDVQYPRLIHEGFAVEAWGDPVQDAGVTGQEAFATTTFSAVLVPAKAGALALGPAALACRVLVPSRSGSAEAFFGAQEVYTLELQSEKVVIPVKALPDAGRPSDFTGALGRFDLAVDIHPREVREGDPVRVTMTVRGDGNLSAAACPAPEAPLNRGGGFRVYPPLLTQEKGGISCEQVWIPLSPDVKFIPPIRFSFFDPEAERYGTLRTRPLPLTVSAAVTGSLPAGGADAARQESGFGLRLLWPAPFLLIAAGVAWGRRARIEEWLGGRWRRRRRRQRLKRALGQAEKLLNQADPGGFYTLLFRALQSFLGDICRLPPSGITEEVVATALPPHWGDLASMEKMKLVFSQCHRARYAPWPADREDMKETLAAMREIMDHQP